MAVEVVLRVYRNQANGKPADAAPPGDHHGQQRESMPGAAQSDELRGMGRQSAPCCCCLRKRSLPTSATAESTGCEATTWSN